MKYLVIFFLLMPFVVFSQSNKKKSKEKKIQAYFDYKVFQVPGDTLSYVECYLEFVATKIQYQSVNEHDLQGRIAVGYQVQRGDSVYASNVYKMDTPVMKDSVVDNFYEIFRFTVPAGAYELNLDLLDVYAEGKVMSSKQFIEVPLYKRTPSISSPIIAESITNANGEESRFVKNNLMILPRIRNFFETDDIYLPFYIETYNLDLSKTNLLKWKIENDITKEELIEYRGAKKLGNVSDQVVYSTIKIENLPTGEYNLIFQLTDKDNHVFSTQRYFFAKQTNDLDDFRVDDIENMIIDPAFQASITDDSLKYYLNSLVPIVGSKEQSHIMKLSKENNAENIRNYFERFWITMSKHDGKKQSPYDMWLAYKGQVNLVEEKFGASNMRGYVTDRGRVYLQYGSPSSIIVQETSPSEYPYEIWHYDKIQLYSNRTFVFYSPSLIPNKYELLHSDMIGELHNYRWQHELTKRNSPIQNIDDPNDGNIDHFGGNSSIYYNQH